MDDKITAAESDYLYVDESQILNAGKGLFTAIPIFRDEIICYFKGELLSDDEADKRIASGQDQYFITLLNGAIFDSKYSACFAKYANDANGLTISGFENNAEIRLDDEDSVCLIAKKDIPESTEIFCSYGKKYWERHGR